ncbi:MAG: LytTR family DNA-binding domain-containing protein, partial [Ginsengibacter sp.]
VLICLTVAIDFLFAQIQNTSFYLSESLLFGTFWLLFFPLLKIQFRVSKNTKALPGIILVAAILAGIHLFIYPAMVLILSKIFFNHTFSFWQTFNFEITEHFIKLIIVYFLPVPIMIIYENKLLQRPNIELIDIPQPAFIHSLIVSDFNNKKIAISTNDVFYFSANSPYINIHHPSKKYLYSATLKSLQTQLDNKQFIRIHKSYLVNISKVISYQSRLNGDYDLLLLNNTSLRVTRNYAAIFKSAFDSHHRFTAK